jgi:hypothetical protein
MEQLQTNLLGLLSDYWPVLLIGFGVSGVAYFIGRSLSRGPSPDTTKSANLSALENIEVENARDRRANTRRKGNEIEVQIYDKAGAVETRTAWVIDRSLGGLCLMTEQEIPEGTMLNVRPRSNQPTFSVSVEVRSCRHTRDGWKIGCQFQQTPPWNVLMLFG